MYPVLTDPGLSRVNAQFPSLHLQCLTAVIKLSEFPKVNSPIVRPAGRWMDGPSQKIIILGLSFKVSRLTIVMFS